MTRVWQDVYCHPVELLGLNNHPLRNKLATSSILPPELESNLADDVILDIIYSSYLSWALLLITKLDVI